MVELNFVDPPTLFVRQRESALPGELGLRVHCPYQDSSGNPG